MPPLQVAFHLTRGEVRRCYPGEAARSPSGIDCQPGTYGICEQTGELMAFNRDDQQREKRYRTIVYKLLEIDEFSVDTVWEACEEKKSSRLVRRIVDHLTQEGFLERQDSEARGLFRWCDRQRFNAEQWLDGKLKNNRLTQAPLDDRPRERLLAQGAASLRTAELLAILIRMGREGESALQAGEAIAARYADALERLADVGRGEIREVSKAVAVTAYCQIMAGIELGRRVERAVCEKHEQEPVRIRSSADALAFCRRRFGQMAAEAKQEHFYVVCLDTKHQVIDVHTVSVGLLNQSLVAPREVFRPAIRDAASSVILSHNHPSGDPTPSREDLAEEARRNAKRWGGSRGRFSRPIAVHEVLGALVSQPSGG
jgi:DNA repair protein RadC